MNKFKGKFEIISENALYRFQQGGFLRGDYVRIKKSALSHPAVKDMSEQMRSIIEQAIKGDVNYRVSYIKSGKSEAFSGPVDAANIPCCELWADIVFEYAPGMWKDPMTLPMTTLEKVDVGGENGMEGYAPYSKGIKRNNNEKDNIGEVEMTKGKDANRNLTKKNIKLANTKTPKDGRDITKLKESLKMLRENDLIFEGYVNKKI